MNATANYAESIQSSLTDHMLEWGDIYATDRGFRALLDAIFRRGHEAGYCHGIKIGRDAMEIDRCRERFAEAQRRGFRQDMHQAVYDAIAAVAGVPVDALPSSLVTGIKFSVGVVPQY